MWACFWDHFWTPSKNGSGHFFTTFGVPKWVQKGEFISVLGGHGAPWVPKSVLGPESCISRPPKSTQKGAKVVEKLFPNLARRTARSGLNPPPPVKGGTGVFFKRHGSPNPPVLERRKTLWWARPSRRPFFQNRRKMGVSFWTPI